MRDALLVFHRWLALVTSVFILVLAVTGSALVFEGAIDRGLNPQLWQVAAGTRTLSLDTLVSRAQTVSRDSISGLTLATVSDRAWIARAPTSQIFLDPYTGRVMGTRALEDFNRSLPRRLHVLHTSLLAGNAGSELVGIVTLATFLLLVTGVILWWPDMLVKVRWRASWKRVVFDLHHVLGIIAALVLFVISASGSIIHYDALNGAITRLDAMPRPAPPKQPAAGERQMTIALDSAVHAASIALPGARIISVSMPGKPDQPLVVGMRFPEDRTPGGRSRVYVDRYRGGVLLADGTRGAPTGRAISNVMRSMHTGDVLGKPTEVVWLLASLILAWQGVSGALMWWNGRAARAAIRRSYK